MICPEACYNTSPDSPYDSETPARYSLAQEERVARLATSSSRLNTSPSCATNSFETTSVPQHDRRRRCRRCRRCGTSLPGRIGRREIHSSKADHSPTARDQDTASRGRAEYKRQRQLQPTHLNKDAPLERARRAANVRGRHILGCHPPTLFCTLAESKPWLPVSTTHVRLSPDNTPALASV
jgi:hypothetical protein